jgi:hypothetical protein
MMYVIDEETFDAILAFLAFTLVELEHRQQRLEALDRLLGKLRQHIDQQSALIEALQALPSKEN